MDLNLSHLRSFVVVARIGNLSAAARELGTTQPNLGRQMTALAQEVGMPLLERHSRGVVLTEQGQEFLELCQNTIGQLEFGTSIIREKSSDVQGTLKVIAGTSDSEKILDNIHLLFAKFPKLSFKIFSITDIYQFKIGETDVGIIPTASSDPDLVQHLLYYTNLRIYASPAYIEAHQLPTTLSNLTQHNIILYRGTTDDITMSLNLHLTGNVTKDSEYRNCLEVNTGLALRKALLSGLGIGTFWYDAELLEKNLLVDVFPKMESRKIPYYYTYHRRLEGSPKIKIFHDFLKEIVKIWDRPEKK